ncbi:MAG: exodeoxyribonuclease III [Mariniblastus sp.]|nr:exodeoxyribonuclease III [Mariniblastus sp.]
MKIVSYNVNGVRSALEKGLVEWIDQHQFDVICIQETKAHSGSVPVLLIESLGYRHYWHSAKRKGYSGVATFTKQKPNQVNQGMGIPKYDDEGRVIRIDLGELTILNCYFPNGHSGPERQAYKMSFLEDFLNWVNRLRVERPNMIVVGDYNIAHAEIDITDPLRKENTSGFKREERQWMSKWFDSGFVDAFRHLFPDETSYTWWRTTRASRQTTPGWRLDYQSVSRPISDRITSVTHLQDAFHSDHCPVLLEIDLN